MKLYIKYDMTQAFRVIVEEQMQKLGLPCDSVAMGEVTIRQGISMADQEKLNESLKKYGFEILISQKSILVQKIKDAIVEMVYTDDKLPATKISAHLAEKLNHTYTYLSNVFSEVTYTPIESFIILQKVERAKQMMIADELTLTEIAFRLNYSSVAHLSHQFKKTTGLSPTAFQRIIRRRRNMEPVTDS